MTDSWDPAQYAKILAEREQPFYDLLEMIQRAPGMRIVDLGCGMGRLTTMLHDRLRAEQTIGIDRSARMLDAAQGRDGLRFESGTIESFDSSAEYDLVFSNAALHFRSTGYSAGDAAPPEPRHLAADLEPMDRGVCTRC